MRSGFDKLSMIIRERMKARVVDGDLFLFLGKNRKRLKGLCYDGTGLILIAKRLEHGKFMSIDDLEFDEITVDELDWLLRGSVVRRTKFGEQALTTKETQSILNSDEAARARDERRSSQAVVAVDARRTENGTSEDRVPSGGSRGR
jgi:hypothetical protein